MADHKPEEPKPSDFQEAAQRSQDAGIADESAAYQNAAEKSDEEAGGNSSGGGEGEAEAHPS
ncbi:hypothetical protein [Sphingomonas mucosissima]|uniref:Uncharacterized protein n=1 Tax=Sphingomonas mucosissima TaxID=370959 RepID=A0A245ZRK0_9SPHN|nr:hypothetical protein [Sphingomonas mucosissima]OWK32367.1 hypothetical protein SPMU_06920 [Sphingomonas mucosissima]